jgi:hypothetical protein
MVAAATAGSPSASPVAGGGGATVPFILASNIYVEKFNSVTTPLGTSQQPQTINIIPNGYMSGIRMELRSSGATAGTAAADSPWNVYPNIELDNIDGANIIYPMPGYSHYAGNWFFKPWLGDPARRWDYAQSINPSCSLFIQPEIRGTAGVLANTDARSQYKIAYTLNTAAAVVSGISGTLSTTTTLYLETWAQPDARDLHNNPQEPVPPGLNLQTLRRHQILTLNGAGSSNTFQLANTGNELRGVLMIVRDSSNVRQDWLTDPIRVRLDTRAMGTFSPSELFNQMNDNYDQLQNSTSVRPTGVYMWQRFRDPGDFTGQGWLTTTNATYMIFESATSASGTIGTVEIITDEAIPVGPVPAELDSI